MPVLKIYRVEIQDYNDEEKVPPYHIATFLDPHMATACADAKAKELSLIEEDWGEYYLTTLECFYALMNMGNDAVYVSPEEIILPNLGTNQSIIDFAIGVLQGDPVACDAVRDVLKI